ncbi:ComEC/Rec2 family competence protein, partial [Streptomyces sp. UNOC14_S4]|uniref:ComEC/Rec2 family competence protein n=1 Tax=Streptomyces sp. UNOC14_S4 TaxID=2872340 RepID=UPI0035B0EEDC|nr:ComEC/Rec2 family competence protein [Streptomyces sp. UNOC14_S4]
MTAPAPPQGPPADHRLIAPAAAAWAAAAAALVTDGRTVAVAVALAVATACVLVLRARARPETSAPSGARGRAASCGFAAGARPAADGPHSPDGMADRANGSRRRSTGRAPQGARVQVASCGSAAWARPAAHNPQAAPTEPTHHSNGRDRITKPHRTAAAAATAPAIAITIAAVLLCAAASAASAALTAADTRRGPLPPLAARYAEVTLEVTVTSDPRSTRPHVRGASRAQPTVVLEGEATRLLHGGRETAADGTAVRATALRTPVLVIAHPSWLGLLPSTKVKVAGRLAPPARQGDRVAAVVRVAGQGPPEVVGRPDALQRVAARLRAGLRSATDGLEPDARALLPGLVVGDTSRIPPDLEEAFRATDLTHLLAVSGSNLAILITVLVGPPHLAARAERRGLAARFGVPLRLTAVLGAVLVLGFVVVCRPEPSVLRAAVCGLITLMAIGTGRRRSLLPALAAAVLLLVLYDPWLSRSYGFALSVLATGALITLAPRWGDALRRRGVPARAAEALAAAAAAQAVCGPVIAVMAARVSLVAVPCNLLAELAVAPATVLGFAALVTAPVAPPLAQGLAWLAGWPTSWAASVARTGADLPGAELGWLGGWPGGLLLAVVTATAVVAARGASRRPWLCAACALLLMIAVIRPAPLTRVVTGWPPPGWRFAACDVG